MTTDPNPRQCVHLHLGLRCANAGAFADTTRGFDGPGAWYCAVHYLGFNHRYTEARPPEHSYQTAKGEFEAKGDGLDWAREVLELHRQGRYHGGLYGIETAHEVLGLTTPKPEVRP